MITIPQSLQDILGKTTNALEIKNANQLEKKLDSIVLLFQSYNYNVFPLKHFLAF